MIFDSRSKRQLLIGILAAAVTLYIDSLTPLGVAGGEPYAILVLLALLTRDRRMIFLSGIAGTVLTIVGFYISPPGVEEWIARINRIQSLIVIWTAVVLCLMQNRYAGALREASDVLERRVRERTAEIEEANRSLIRETGYTQLHKDIAVSSNENQPVEVAMRYTVGRICRETGWPVGHLYLTDRERGKVLLPTDVWYMEDGRNFETFRRVTEATALNPGIGLPGRVLATGRPAWIMDVTQDPNFPRALLAKDIGVRAGFAFPILIGPEVVGVLEFFSVHAAEPDPRLLEIMGNIGTLLGRVVERRDANLERDLAENRLRRLYHRVERVREEESTRIAREVHDELGQVLSTLKLELSLLQKQSSVQEHPDLSPRVEMMKSFVENTIQTVKRISQELRPPVLDVLGLSEAIEWQGGEFAKRTGIAFALEDRPRSISLDPQRSTTLFRIFQEALTNILRHAAARRITVRLIDLGSEIMLIIKDDGKGITAEQIGDRRALGIMGMRERALVWGGTVDIQGAPGQGTTVTIKIPSRETQNGNDGATQDSDSDH